MIKSIDSQCCIKRKLVSPRLSTTMGVLIEFLVFSSLFILQLWTFLSELNYKDLWITIKWFRDKKRWSFNTGCIREVIYVLCCAPTPLICEWNRFSFLFENSVSKTFVLLKKIMFCRLGHILSRVTPVSPNTNSQR